MQFGWTEDTFESLFKFLAKREASHFLSTFLNSETTKAIFCAMSYFYRLTFMERILGVQDELMAHINQMLHCYTQKAPQ